MSKPSAVELIADWLQLNTNYNIRLQPVGAETSTRPQIVVINIQEHGQPFAVLFHEPETRWHTETGVYFLADFLTGKDESTKLLPVGDPNYFPFLKKVLDDGPRVV